jgi:hypothetical protein
VRPRWHSEIVIATIRSQQKMGGGIGVGNGKFGNIQQMSAAAEVWVRRAVVSGSAQIRAGQWLLESFRWRARRLLLSSQHEFVFRLTARFRSTPLAQV